LRREAALLQRKAAAAEEQARHDPLTGLLNRAGFDADARPLLERSQGDAHGENRTLSMAWIDVDRFKLVNDRYGHAVGDVVLATVGRMLREQLRSGDLAARQGGDEFVVLIRDTDRDSALRSFERLHETVRMHAWHEIAPGLEVTVSVGCAQWRDGEALGELARRADDAMYAAKRAGRDQVGSA
jgi:diguanylate cyclase (GGDEF)-like protein